MAATLTGRFWRMLAPKWAHRPLSGDGAALHGGRFNEPGMPALYMSADFATAIAEYQQDLGIRPGTLCAYDVAVTSVIDLSDTGIREATGIALADLKSPWKQIAFADKNRPPTWDMARRFFDTGINGIRVPSMQRLGGANVVLWRWNDAPNRTVMVLDPLRDLPKDQASWQP
jgi:RES domain-containing protein